jgi:two-component system phosphate regulon sensor histidine kinase PhoR
MPSLTQTATPLLMDLNDLSPRAMVDALDEPSIVVSDGLVRLANGAAQALFGSGIEGRDVRLAIRHPQALDRILSHRAGDIDATGIAEIGRSWRVSIRELGKGAVLVRLVDRSASVSAGKMRVDFVANASHELRTPLSTILGYAETLAEEGKLPDDMRINFGRTMRDEAKRMERIIEDLMSLSRIEADRFVPPRESVDVADAVNASLANAGHVRSAAQCRIDVDLPDDLPPVRGDRGQLIQLFDNLIGNAVRYGCDRPGACIELSAKAENGFVSINVKDQGPGIARQHLPRLTERFYRVDDARSRESGGTGLGLAIVKHIVERHRGSLDIQSTLGMGTSVTVSLPVGS